MIRLVSFIDKNNFNVINETVVTFAWKVFMKILLHRVLPSLSFSLTRLIIIRLFCFAFMFCLVSMFCFDINVLTYLLYYCLCFTLLMSLCWYIFLYFNLDVHIYISSCYSIYSDIIYCLDFELILVRFLSIYKLYIYLHIIYLANLI